MLQSQYKVGKIEAGFTLVELVIVIIILGVLAVTALPKLVGKSAFEDYAVRDQLISRLRLVQLQGMNADSSDDATDNACYWLVVKPTCFYNEHTEKVGGICNSPAAASLCSGDDYDQYSRISFSDKMLSSKNYRFTIDGRLSSDSGTSPIYLNGDNNLSVIIESQGYIHE